MKECVPHSVRTDRKSLTAQRSRKILFWKGDQAAVVSLGSEFFDCQGCLATKPLAGGRVGTLHSLLRQRAHSKTLAPNRRQGEGEGESAAPACPLEITPTCSSTTAGSRHGRSGRVLAAARRLPHCRPRGASP